MIHLEKIDSTNIWDIVDLKVFKNQKSSYAYKGLINGIKVINDKACSVLQSDGGVNTQEEFNTYHDCAEELMQLLIDRVPTLLKGESFFADIFYN